MTTGTIHIEFNGDLYDGVKTKEVKAVKKKVSLGPVRLFESVTLVDQDKVKITVDSITYSDSYYPQLNFGLKITNENKWPVELNFIRTEKSGKTTRTIYFQINGKDCDYSIRKSSNYMSRGDIYLLVPAGTEDERYTLTIESYDDPLPTVDELKNGKFAIRARMPVSKELSKASTNKWPDLFIIDPFTFDMAGGELPEAISVALPGIEEMNGFTLFDIGGISFTIEDVMPLDSNPAHVDLFGKLVNNTDADIYPRFFDVKLNDHSTSYTLMLLDNDFNILKNVPAHGECLCQVSLSLLTDQDTSFKKLTGTFRVVDSNTGKSVILQPYAFTR